MKFEEIAYFLSSQLAASVITFSCDLQEGGASELRCQLSHRSARLNKGVLRQACSK